MRRLAWFTASLLIACGGSSISALDEPDASPGGSAVQPTPTPGTPTPDPVRPAETCNGLDDDDALGVDDDRVCPVACEAAAVAAAARKLRLPRADDVTVASEAEGEVPELALMRSLPTFCVQPPASQLEPGPGAHVDVACGATLVVRDRWTARSLRVAPGGVVRVEADAQIQLEDELLVCPGAFIQAGGAPARVRPASPASLDGKNLELRARTGIILGTIEARGARVFGEEGVRGGDSGSIKLEVERILFAGLIDNKTPSPYRGESGGQVSLVATHESFISGTVNAGGNIYVKVPVCCHGD